MTLSIDTITVSKPVLPPEIEQLTSETDTGVFDVLMATIKKHLQIEYDANRITSDDYATVYLGALNAVLSQSIQFLVNQQNIEKINAEIGLIHQQTVTELAQTDDLIPMNLGFNDSTSIEGIIQDQKNINAQKLLEIQKNNELIDKNIKLIEQKTITELAQTDDNLPLNIGYNNTTDIEGLIAVEKAKLLNDSKLIEQKVITEIAQINDTLPADIGSQSSTTISGIIQTTKDKINAEIDYTKQKTITELAQTDNDIPSTYGLNNSTVLEGLIKSQKDLITQQIAESVKNNELTDKNIELVEQNKELTEQKIVTELAQTDDDIPQSLGYNNSTSLEGLIKNQKDKITHEISLMDQKLATEQALKLKIEAEADFYEQKTVTEVAQTCNTLPDSLGYNNTTTIEGMVYTKALLLTEQINGYKRDAEQKAAKIMTDVYNIQRSTAPTGTPGDDTNRLGAPDIGAVIAKMQEGIGITIS